MTMNRRELMQGIVASAVTAAALPRTASSSVVDHSHPRLYLTPLTLAHLRQRFRTDADWAAQLRGDGEAMLSPGLSRHRCQSGRCAESGVIVAGCEGGTSPRKIGLEVS